MTWVDEDLQIHALHFVSLVINYNIQLCGITRYSITILVIVPMYFNYFNALLCGLQGVLVAKKYQMGSDVDIST